MVPGTYTRKDITKGAIFTAHRQDSGRMITPQEIDRIVTIRWLDVEAGLVYYSLDASPTIRDTPIDRFLTIINTPPHTGKR